MAMSKRFNPKKWKRFYRKRKQQQQNATVGTMTVPVLKKALGIRPPEVKVFDTLQIANIGTTATSMLNPSTVPQGLTNQTRLGRAITVKRFQVHLTLIPDPSATDPGLIRVIYFLQKYPNSNLLTSAEILQTNTALDSFYQFDSSGYRILYDKVFSFAVNDPKNQYVKMNLPCRGELIEWTEGDTLGNQNNLTQGYIRGLIMYNGFGAFAPSYNLWQRLTYTDS